ncbi:DUF2147 domain-containing protein [Ruegeria meonggei]|uniref:DUF2147 domain-containing protein n=1 Tax=Ruegeria meonggei TaxID=1446476 RepID=A0A1X6YHI9_9RHOB|nr:DUF2147 domain-containing protein [Ruegeria meonggei]SLN19739.1 hypothetical protein RUM8411_00680 [Ruegeria meonggei]
MTRHLILGGIAAVLMSATTVAADPVDGLWKTGTGDDGGYLHVSIAPCGSAICGTIDSAFNSAGDQELNYEHDGKQMIWDMVPDGSGGYSGGQIWDPEADKNYKSKMQLNGNTLVVKGCVAGGLICKGQDWTRIQ